MPRGTVPGGMSGLTVRGLCLCLRTAPSENLPAPPHPAMPLSGSLLPWSTAAILHYSFPAKYNNFLLAFAVILRGDRGFSMGIRVRYGRAKVWTRACDGRIGVWKCIQWFRVVTVRNDRGFLLLKKTFYLSFWACVWTSWSFLNDQWDPMRTNGVRECLRSPLNRAVVCIFV